MLHHARLALVLICATFSVAADGDYVRLILEPGAGAPFSVVRYEVFQRGDAVAAVHRRQLPGYGESLQGMGLLTAPEATEIWTRLLKVDAFELPDAGPPKGLPWSPRQRWRVELSREGRSHAFTMVEPRHQQDRRYARLLDDLTSMVEAAAGEQPFRNVFFPDAELGWLDIESVPVARLVVDGEDTRLETPTYGYEVPAGPRRITLTPVVGDDRRPRSYDVVVEPTGTTRLRVFLR